MHLTCQDKQLRVRRLTIGLEWSGAGLRAVRYRAGVAMCQGGLGARRREEGFLPVGAGVSHDAGGAVRGAGSDVAEWGEAAPESGSAAAEWGMDPGEWEWPGGRRGVGRNRPGKGWLSPPAYNPKTQATAGKRWYDWHLRDFFHGARRLLDGGGDRRLHRNPPTARVMVLPRRSNDGTPARHNLREGAGVVVFGGHPMSAMPHRPA